MSQYQELFNEGKLQELVETIEITTLDDLALAIESHRILLEHAQIIELLENEIYKSLHSLPVDWMHYHSHAGYSHWYLGNFKLSLAHYNQALQLARESGQLQWEGKILVRICVILENQGKFDEALRYVEKASDLFLSIQEMWDFIYTRYEMGYIYQVKGELDTASSLYEQGIELLKTYSDDYLSHEIKRNMSKVRYEQGNLDEAIELVEESIDLIRKSSKVNEWSLAHSLNRMIEYTTTTDREKCQAYFEESEELRRNSNNPRVRKIAEFSRGLYLKHSEDPNDRDESAQIFSLIIQEPKLRQEFFLRAYVNLLDLQLGGNSQLNNIQLSDKSILSVLKGEIERQDLKETLIESMKFEAELASRQGDTKVALEKIEKAKRIAFENHIYGALLSLSKNERKYRNQIIKLQKFNSLPLNIKSKELIVGIDEIFELPSEVIPAELYRYKFLFNPIRIGILRSLLDVDRLSTVELKEELQIPWGLFNTHVDALKKKNYVFIRHEMGNQGTITSVSINPDVISEFKEMLALLRLFLHSMHVSSVYK